MATLDYDNAEYPVWPQPEFLQQNPHRLRPAREPKPFWSQADSVEARKPCVLVADDDHDIVRLLKTVFRNLDVDTHFVGDGRAALYAARSISPDLLLLDLGMPIMNGMDVLRSLRKDAGTSSLATVLITGSSDPEHVKEGADLGALDYILKPFSYLEITLKLKALLAAHNGSIVEDRLPNGNFFG